ncbi:MAG: SusC/RagA family TonB-linked outer membrane protein, partial [Bacteroidota bacterium]
DNVEVSSLSMINPDDIKEISVLKDAASASIYGARGAWGVILIETKSGEYNKETRVNYSNNFSWNTPTEIPDIAGSVEGAEMQLASGRRVDPNTDVVGLLNMYYDEEGIQKMKDWRQQYGDQDLGPEMELGRDFEYRDGRWFYYRPWDAKEMFLRDWSPQQKHNVNVTGGSEKTSYNLSFGYVDEEGALKPSTDEFKRYNATLNLRSQVTDWLTLRGRAMFSKSNNQSPYSFGGSTYDPWYYLMRWPKTYPYGTYEGKPFRNAVTEVNQAKMVEEKETMQRVNLGSTVNLAEGWTLDVDYTYTENNDHTHRPGGWVEGINHWFISGDDMADAYGKYTSSGHNMVEYISDWDETSTFKAYSTYNNDFGDHSVKLMGGTDIESFEYWRHDSERRSLIDRDKPELRLATGDQFVGGGRDQWSTMGVFGRLNYSFKDRYLFELNGRYDGSSRFPEADQWGFFPSFSAGYRITEEPWMDFVQPYLSSLKFRGSWGSVGNHDVGTNTFVPTMDTYDSNWLMGSQNMLTLGNPRVVPASLTWETVTTVDYGFDARFFDNSFGVVFDWYQRTTSDMVSSGETLPNSFGATAPQQNFGEVQTTGWEITVDWRHQFANGLKLNAEASIWDFQEEITKFASDDNYIYGNYEGKKIGEIWGYETDRIFTKDDFVTDADGNIARESDGTYQMKEGIPDQDVFESGWFYYGPGDVKYKDLDGDGEINYGDNTVEDHGDLKRIGNETPRYQYSFRFGGSFRGFDMNAFFQGVGKRDFWATGPTAIPGSGDAWYEHQTDYWTPDNKDAFYPRPTNHSWAISSRNFLRQTKYLSDMSYLRLKNLTVGYTLPNYLTSRAGVEKLRIYFSGENLFEFDNMDIPLDPETGQREEGNYFTYGRSYPFKRTISVGLQMTL